MNKEQLETLAKELYDYAKYVQKEAIKLSHLSDVKPYLMVCDGILTIFKSNNYKRNDNE